MPIYEYECPGCGEVFEELTRNLDAQEAACPRCGTAARRVVSPSSFALKGGGWPSVSMADRRPEFIQRAGRPRVKGRTVAPQALAKVPGGAPSPEEPQEPEELEEERPDATS